MTTINLKDFYSWYTQDEYMEVSDEVAEELRANKRYEAAYRRRVTRNKAQYSLDCDDGIEYSACVFEPSPEEYLARAVTIQRLCYALHHLPPAQGRRIDAHYLLGQTVTEIAEAEGLDESSIRESINRGLRRMRKIF